MLHSFESILIPIQTSGLEFRFMWIWAAVFGILVRLEFRFMWIRAAVFSLFGVFSTTGIPFYVDLSGRFFGLLVQGFQLKLQIFIASSVLYIIEKNTNWFVSPRSIIYAIRVVFWREAGKRMRSELLLLKHYSDWILLN